jgi:IS5 family transposase
MGSRDREVNVDMSYRGHSNDGRVAAHIDKRLRGRTLQPLWRWMKRRTAVQPSIGQLKNEHWLERNRLRGTYGDAINAVLPAAAMNFRKLFRAFWLDFLHFLLGIRSQFQLAVATIGL